MRTLHIVLLLVGFVLAVISPNEIGTPDLPATVAKTIVKTADHNWHKPRGHGQDILVLIEELQYELLASFSERIVWRSVRTIWNLQLSSPLLI